MMNKALLIGNVGKDVATTVTTNGTTIAKFSLATSSTWKDKNGQKKTETQWHDIVCFGKGAEILSSYVKKGSKIYIEGEIQYGEYTDKNGVKRKTTSIRCEDFRLLDSASSRAKTGGSSDSHDSNDSSYGSPSTSYDDDIPF